MKRTCLMVRPRRLVHHSPSQSADHRRIVCLFSPIFCVIFAEQSQTFQNDLEGVRGGRGGAGGPCHQFYPPTPQGRMLQGYTGCSLGQKAPEIEIISPKTLHRFNGVVMIVQSISSRPPYKESGEWVAIAIFGYSPVEHIVLVNQKGADR